MYPASASFAPWGAQDPAVDLQVRSRGRHEWNVGRRAVRR
jgi:hypothetical protein